MIGLPQRLAFLKKSHLFSGVSDEVLARLAEQMEERVFAKEEVIFPQGSKDRSLYFIYDGKVLLQRREGRQSQPLAVLQKGDYFGEEGAYLGRPRSATAIAATNVTLLVLDAKGETLRELLRAYHHLRPNFEVAIESRRLARRLRFKWLRPNEVVYFLARKHPIALYEALLPPALLSIIPLTLYIIGLLPMLSPNGRISAVPLALATVILLGLIGWAIWQYIDWGNDYYIVTNERVIWMEKVVGIHQSRTEAPITTVLSVSVETSYWGRILGYGNVIIRTFVGQIPFHNVTHAAHAARMIEELWQRSKEASLGEEKEKMKAAIRERLGLPAPPTRSVSEDLPAALSTPPEHPPHPLKVLLSQWFTLRIEAGDTITYRKHWVVVLRNIFGPLLFLLLLLGLLILRANQIWRDPERALLVFRPAFHLDLLSVLLFFALFWPISVIIWRYMDWMNDIFQVSGDQIIDIDRKPFFGQESRSSAPIENILSTSYERNGILANLFNFGTVYITVGGSTMAFEDVQDPAGVQADIDRRRMARMIKKKEAEAALERERMANWLAVYHQSADELRALERGPNPKHE